jgi:hypothetical protein
MRGRNGKARPHLRLRKQGTPVPAVKLWLKHYNAKALPRQHVFTRELTWNNDCV